MKYLSTLLIILVSVSACKNSKSKTDAESNTILKPQAELLNTKASEPTTVSEKTKIVSIDDMTFFEGGVFTMGRNDGLPQEAPAHEVNVKPFYLDKYLVSVKQFGEFIKATGHITEAERFGDSGVFDFETGQWSLKPKTTWEYPLGVEKGKAQADHPVTHVSWRDALAYAKWAGKRLVTEAEWEFAARNGGKTQQNYTWGNSIKVNGKWMANVFQGTVQDYDVEDGYLFTSPVGAFGASENGLTDMSGNVWEWMADVYRPYPGSNIPYREDSEVKSTRGGSFMYDEAGEASFSVYFRSLNSTETSLFNTGFRCALSPNNASQK